MGERHLDRVMDDYGQLEEWQDSVRRVAGEETPRGRQADLRQLQHHVRQP